MSKRRSFSMEQKLQILRDAENKGMLATCREYEIGLSLFYRWKHVFDQKDIHYSLSYKRRDHEITNCN